MKTVEDAVRELGGAWSKAYEPGGDYLWAIGDIWQALDSPTGYFGEFICTREEFDECKTKLEGKSMKLIDILAREMEEWPAGYERVTQLADGRILYDYSTRGQLHFTLSRDWITAFVTREQWEEARRGSRSCESLTYTEAGPDLADSVMSPPVDDPVNSPSHYRQGGVECIDAIEAALTTEEFRGYCKGNAQKYIWRELHKGGNESIAKAAWYLDRLKEEA